MTATLEKFPQIKPARFKMPVEKEDAGARLHVPDEWLELYEAGEFLAASKDPDHVAHANLVHAPTTQRKALGTWAGVFQRGAAPVVSRAAWGARNPKGAYGSISPSSGGVALHYEGPKMGSFPHSSCATKVRGIQAFHMDQRNWLDIAYSALTCPHGYIFVGRWVNNRTAAQGTNDGNNRFYAVCGLWGSGDPLTDDAKGAYLDAINIMRTQGRAGTQVKPHRFFHATECPGVPVVDWIAAGLPAPPGYFDAPPPPPPAPSTTLPSRLADPAGFIEDPSSDGGWLLSSSGGVFTMPPSGFFGSLGGVRLNAPIVGGVATPSGKGYWIFGADGGVFAFGDAPFNGTYGKLGEEYAAGHRKIIGGFFRGNPADRATWRYTLVSDRLEGYAI